MLYLKAASDKYQPILMFTFQKRTFMPCTILILTLSISSAFLSLSTRFVVSNFISEVLSYLFEEKDF